MGKDNIFSLSRTKRFLGVKPASSKASQECAPERGDTELSRSEVEALYETLHERLVTYVVAKGLPRAEAEEVVQEAFMRLLTPQNKNVSSYLQAYLFRIVSNLTVDRLRKSSRKLESSSSDDSYDEPIDESASPEPKIAYLKLLERIESAIATLPDKCQSAFLLYKIKGYDYQMISLELGISESMVRKYVLRAIRHSYDTVKHDL